MEVFVIKPGKLVRDANGFILDARSTITLIRTGHSSIIVDTGLYDEAALVIKGLGTHNLTCEDIDIVINTHLHGDHTGNNHLFTAAKFLVHEHEGPRARTGSSVQTVIEGYTPAKDVTIIHTPGHTRGSMSVVARVNKHSCYVIAGDALPTQDNYVKWVPPGIHYDYDIALGSMKKIIGIADIVIPGHDQPFRVTGDHRENTS